MADDLSSWVLNSYRDITVRLTFKADRDLVSRARHRRLFGEGKDVFAFGFEFIQVAREERTGGQKASGERSEDTLIAVHAEEYPKTYPCSS